MARKRYSVEQIVAKLRGAEKLEVQGYTVAQRCKRLAGESQPPTTTRWLIPRCWPWLGGFERQGRSRRC